MNRRPPRPERAEFQGGRRVRGRRRPLLGGCGLISVAPIRSAVYEVRTRYAARPRSRLRAERHAAYRAPASLGRMGYEDRRPARRSADTVPAIWRARDIAQLYGVDESTVRRWERAGALRAARLDPGGAKYWLRDEIIADTRAHADGHGVEPPRVPHVDVLVASTKRPRRRREVAR